MPGLAFRTAVPDDAETLTMLERAATTTALVHIFGTERPYPTDDVRARWAIVLEDPTVTALLASDGDDPVGYAAIDSIELRHFGVHPDRFGSGIADALHAEVLRALAATGVARPRLWVLAENRRARRFYRRHGWRPDGRSAPSEFPPYPEQVGYTYGS